MIKTTDFIIENGELLGYTGGGGRIAVPDGVLYIGEDAFRGNKKIKEVIIPESVKEIRKHAFYWCVNLEKATPGKNVELLGSGAFAYCEKLTEFVMPDSVKDMGEWLFYNCLKLNKIVFSKNVKVVGDNMLAATGLKDFVLPAHIEKIGKGAFQGSKIESFKAGGGLKEIGVIAFEKCFSLKTVSLSEGLKKIDIWAFNHCPKIEELRVPASVEFVGSHAFHGFTNKQKVYVKKAAVKGYSAEWKDGSEALIFEE